MILNRRYYLKVSPLKEWWFKRQLSKLAGDKVFKSFKLLRTVWPNKLYFYSSRLKKIPRFTGDLVLLSQWKESKMCETICPTLAIKVTDKTFAIDEASCIACGLCVEVAPPGILEIPSGFSFDKT